MISVSGEHWERTDKFYALAQRIADARVQRVAIVVRVRGDTAHHGFHNVAGRSFNDNIAGVTLDRQN